MPEQLLAFAVTSLAIELTPGPNMAYLAVLSVDRGRLAGLAAVAGVAAGLLLLGIIAGIGAGAVVSETRWLYETLRWGGVGYLLWLGWDSYREAQKPVAVEAARKRLGDYFVRGLVTNLLNPKAALFYIAVLPNFVTAGAATRREEIVLTLTYVAVATAVHAGIVLLGGSLQPIVASGKWRARIGIVSGLLLVAIAIWLAITTQRSWG